MKRIEHYADYRAFLADFCVDRKRRRTGFSCRNFCRRAGISSPSLLREVIQGKRNLTVRTIPAFIRGLGLTRGEAAFFALLVRFNQSRSPDEKQQCLDQMRGLRRTVRQAVIPLDGYGYFSHWYNPVIRELACCAGWRGDYRLLGRAVNPPITAAEARESVALLLKLGMIRQLADGSFTQSDPAITTGPEVASVGVRRLNRRFAELGVDAIDRIAPSQRDCSSMTLGISRRGFLLVKEEIQEFKRRLVRIADNDKESDMVCNLNVHLFPVADGSILKGGGHA